MWAIIWNFDQVAPSKMRVINLAMRKRKIMVNTRNNINTLVSCVHSPML